HREAARRRFHRRLALRLRELRADALAVAEAARALALDAAAEAFGGDVGVPLVGAVAEHVQPAQVDQLLEAEFVAQRAAGVEPVAGVQHQADLAARQRDLDRGLREARAELLREALDCHGHPRCSGVCAPGTLPVPKVLLRRIFFCSCRIPYTSASAVGGQPGTYTSTGTMRSQPRTTE